MFLVNIVYNYTDKVFFFFFSSRRRHTRLQGDWSSDVCSSDLSSSVSAKISAMPEAGRNVNSRSPNIGRSEEHTSELQSPCNLVCRLLLEKKKKKKKNHLPTIKQHHNIRSHTRINHMTYQHLHLLHH